MAEEVGTAEAARRAIWKFIDDRVNRGYSGLHPYRDDEADLVIDAVLAAVRRAAISDRFSPQGALYGRGGGVTGRLPVIRRVRGRALPAGAVYVGRDSRWGNPFEIGKDGTREEVIAKYRALFDNHREIMMAKVAALADRRPTALACWCAPEPCHADVLAELLSEGVRSGSEVTTAVRAPRDGGLPNLTPVVEGADNG